MEIVQDPTRMLKKYWSEGIVEYELGQLELALELESYKRRILSLPGSSLLALSKEELATAVDTFFRERNLDLVVAEWYERLLEEQRAERVTGFESV